MGIKTTSQTSKKKLVILSSHRGTNFVAIAQAIQSQVIKQASVEGLIYHRQDAPVIERAKELNIKTYYVPIEKNITKQKRQQGEKKLFELLESLSPDLICLAGYLLILPEKIIERWPSQIINIHPSLLPSFKGLHAQKKALEYGVQWTGCTVHFVTKGLDAGPIILQEPLKIESSDTEESLSRRLLLLEHQAYILALSSLCQRSYRIKGRHVVFDSSSKKGELK